PDDRRAPAPRADPRLLARPGGRAPACARPWRRGATVRSPAGPRRPVGPDGLAAGRGHDAPGGVGRGPGRVDRHAGQRSEPSRGAPDAAEGDAGVLGGRLLAEGAGHPDRAYANDQARIVGIMLTIRPAEVALR